MAVATSKDSDISIALSGLDDRGQHELGNPGSSTQGSQSAVGIGGKAGAFTRKLLPVLSPGGLFFLHFPWTFPATPRGAQQGPNIH